MTQPQTKRVHQLAKELGLTPQALLSLLPKLPRPILAETIMAHLSMEEVAYIRAQVLHHGAAPEAKVDLFGELRGLLAQPPSPQSWAALLHEVCLTPKPQVLQYLHDQLRDWPEQIPRPPSDELLASLLDDPHPALRLCDTLILSDLQLRDAQLIKLIEGGWFSGVRTLDLSRLGLSARCVIALANSPHSSALRALNLSYNTLNAAAFKALGQSPHLHQLKRLALEGVSGGWRFRDDLYKSPLGRRLSVIRTGAWSADLKASSRELVELRREASLALDRDDGSLDALMDRLSFEPKRWGTYSHKEQLSCAQALRDLYFMARRDDASEALREQVRQASELIPALEPFVVEAQLQVSWHPSQRHKQLRLLPTTIVTPGQRALCHRTRCLAQEFIAVFVDPQELNYQCFENILPLDSLFEREGLALEPGELNRLHLASGLAAFTLKVQPSEVAADTLLALSQSELYLPPSPGSARGGQRFIFHSASLAKALTRTLKASLPSSCLGSGAEAFVHAGRGHISRYTLLLYLSGGRASSALTLGELTLDELDAMTCVIFDQRIEHEGAPYDDGDKLFLRTELIFGAKKLEHKPDIAQHFSKACYLNQHCAVFPQLSAVMGQRYEQAARAHWGLDSAAPGRAPEPYLHKRYKGVEFFTNGYDFWCSSAQLGLKEAAALAILDHLNCHIDEAAFHSLCEAQVVSLAHDEDLLAWMEARLQGLEPPSSPLFWTLDKDILQASRPKGDEFCCPFHHPDEFSASSNADILNEINAAHDRVTPYLEGASLYMFGERIYLDPDRVVVTPDKIFALSHQAPTPINFAACWNVGGMPEDYVGVATTAQLPFLLVPPLLYQQHQGCYHLRLDLFKNDWMLDKRQLKLPLPALDEAGDGEWERAWEEARQALVE